MKQKHLVQKFVLMLACALILFRGTAISVQAQEKAWTELSEILYTTAQTSFYVTPDMASAPVSTVGAGIPVQVTGVTGDGWYRVYVDGVYYVPFGQLTEEPAPAVPKIARTDQIVAQIGSVEEAQALAQQAMEAHATIVYLTSSVNVYSTLGNTVLDEIYAPIHGYEAITIDGLRLLRRGNEYVMQLSRISTIEEEEAVDAAVAQLAPRFAAGSTKDRVVAVHDYICNQIEYSYETLDGTADYKSAYDGLASGQGVCTSYALLFQKFMEEMGIPCYIASRDAGENGHVWNLVQIDGQWYHVDCTWDDQPGYITHRWCLAGADRAGYSSWGSITLARKSVQL